MADRLFVYERETDMVVPVTATVADRDFRYTDAGTNLGSFIVVASDAETALDGARRWVACWKDDNQQHVPDDMGLEERHYRPTKTYMVLRVY
jgi:hypothetical protein